MNSVIAKELPFWQGCSANMTVQKILLSRISLAPTLLSRVWQQLWTCTNKSHFVKDLSGTYPFVKGLRCSLFGCTRIPFAKDCTCKCLFFLSKNGSETFCQGFLLLAYSFCQRMAQKPLSRFLAAGHFFLSKSGSETFCQGFLQQANSFCQRMAENPFVKGSEAVVFNCHISSRRHPLLHPSWPIQTWGSWWSGKPPCQHIWLHHRSFGCLRRSPCPTLAHPDLSTLSCPFTDNRAVVHQPLGLQPLALVLPDFLQFHMFLEFHMFLPVQPWSGPEVAPALVLQHQWLGSWKLCHTCQSFAPTPYASSILKTELQSRCKAWLDGEHHLCH